MMTSLPILLIAVLFGVATRSASLQHIIGYDCSGANAQIMKLDLTSVKECRDDIDTVKVTNKIVQIIQHKTYSPIHIRQCLLEITRDITYCGHASWLDTSSTRQYKVKHGHLSYIQPLGKHACEEIHKSKVFKFQGKLISHSVTLNATETHAVVLSGSIDSNGRCKNGGDYSDAGTSVSNKLVQGFLKLTLSDFYGVLDHDGQTLKDTKHGIDCKTSHQYCIDTSIGEIVWDYVQEDRCHKNKVDVLYTGSADIISGLGTGESKFVKVTTGNTAFALEISGEGWFCSKPTYSTTQERITIIRLEYIEEAMFVPSTILPMNVDLTAYINTKFLLTQAAMGLQLTALYKTLKRGSCENRKLIFENRIALARLNPHEVVKLVEHGEGLFGRVMGEVMFITKCVPILTTHRATSQCYQEFPVVLKDNTTGYLTPITRILTRIGTQTTCSEILSPHFHIGDFWYSRSPSVHQQIPPITLDPNLDENEWNFNMIPGLGHSGLYPEEAMREMQREMMFPASRDAVSSNMMSKVVDEDGNAIAYHHLFNEDDIDTLTSSISGRISIFFKWFGHWASILVAVIIIIKISIALFDIFINCLMIRKSGLSTKFWIFGMFNSLTHWILRRPSTSQSAVPLLPITSGPSNQTSTPPPSPVIIQMPSAPIYPSVQPTQASIPRRTTPTVISRPRVL
ncbi:putative glycoprotein [Sanxia atyid shrimp virus 4]|uniref:Putative glycoprotein n=1 Tax=Sanxia atyid shrimp virus 4 TaxID=1923358 RepID=A0A1L3KMY4_9VIRU|nr:putative glycoprotein [Sanxia atyid shrimp virus 4]APG78771.1 putative glycoprotein [Sanxia atyid shrimp virus 4]